MTFEHRHENKSCSARRERVKVLKVVKAQLFETRYLRHDLADFLDLTEAIIFHTFFFGH